MWCARGACVRCRRTSRDVREAANEDAIVGWFGVRVARFDVSRAINDWRMTQAKALGRTACGR